MKNYLIAFVGMGSIGRRHLMNVCQLITSQGNTFSIDLYRNSIINNLSDEIKILISNQYLCSQDVQQEYDMVFITNPTSLHLDTALKFRPFTKALFIEKPVFKSMDVDERTVAFLDEISSYVACPLRYNPVLQYVKQNVDLEKVCTAQNYVKLMNSMSQNIADSCISDVTHTCLFDVDIAIGCVEIGMSHAGSDELAFDACSMQH